MPNKGAPPNDELEPNDGAPPKTDDEAGEAKGWDEPKAELPGAGPDAAPKPKPDDNTPPPCELNVLPPENPPEDEEPNPGRENGPPLKELLNTSSPDFPLNNDDCVVAGTANP